MDAYFANMTSFTLFKPNDMQQKIEHISSLVEAEALVAAIFSFSARFHSSYHTDDRPDESPPASHFFQIASSRIQTALDRRGDNTPPLWLLQAYILVSFYQLTQSVRSKSWRALGNCVRIAYDMNLHLVDVNRARKSGQNSQDAQSLGDDQWSALEEQRRAWWAIWEMDVFASTIRRSPMGVDWSQNLTMLPIPDSCWFKNIRQYSCFLVEDPSQRWKLLVQSGNTSARAWFIVINSLMQNVQLIVYSHGGVSTTVGSAESKTRQTAENLDAIGNCLYCIVNSLPSELAYYGESLDFQTPVSPGGINCRQSHADKYSIHLMTQLVRFMIHHHRICAQAPWLNTSSPTGSGHHEASHNVPDDGGGDKESLASWSNYMNAAQEIVTIVRTSTREHYKYVNPFLMNTIWFAAAAQIACRVFQPPSFNMQLISTNYDVLSMAIGHFIKFWNRLGMLKSRLSRVEVALRGMMTGDEGVSGNPTQSGGTRDQTRSNENFNAIDLAHNSTAQGNESLVVTSGLAQDFPTSATGAMIPGQAMPGEMNAQTDPPFDTLFYNGVGIDLMDAQQIMADPSSQFFPYGIDDLWLNGAFSQI